MHGPNWLRLWLAAYGQVPRWGPTVTLRLWVEDELAGHLLLPGFRPVPGLALLGRRYDHVTDRVSKRLWLAFSLSLPRGAVTPDLDLHGQVVPLGGEAGNRARLKVPLPPGSERPIPVLLDEPGTAASGKPAPLPPQAGSDGRSRAAD